jgi:hypothetical protein
LPPGLGHVNIACVSDTFRYGESMSKLLRGVAAGYGARKLTGGCGCMGIIVFVILWYILGHFGIFR